MPTNPSTVDRRPAALAAGDAPAPAPLDVQAATWSVRRRDGLDAAGQAELQAWLDADARHAPALADMAATPGLVRQVSAGEQAALWRSLQPDAAAGQAATRASAAKARAARRPWRGAWGDWLAQAAVAAVVVALVGGGWLGWDRWRQQATFAQAYSTERGRQRVATLPDDPANGSQVQLDTATHLEARLFRDRREVHLKDGQAMFTVHADKARPFHVWAGQLHITVVGTRFSVRHTTSGLDAGQTVVSVEEGHVRVARAADPGGGPAANAAPPAPPVELTAGQMLVGDDQGRLGPVTGVAPATIAQWRNGRISFDHTPLAQALAEFERYGSTGLVVRDPAVARLPVGGSYSLQQMRRFAETLPQVLPVQLVQHGELTEIVARRP